MKAILGIKEESLAAALWIMLWSYTEAVALFAQRDPQVKPYRDFCALLGLENPPPANAYLRWTPCSTA